MMTMPRVSVKRLSVACGCCWGSCSRSRRRRAGGDGRGDGDWGGQARRAASDCSQTSHESQGTKNRRRSPPRRRGTTARLAAPPSDSAAAPDDTAPDQPEEDDQGADGDDSGDGQLPPGHPAIGQDTAASPGTGMPAPNTSIPDPELPRGSIQVRVVDGANKPMNGAKVRLGILHQWIAEGETTPRSRP